MPRKLLYANDPIKQRIFNSYRNMRQCVCNPNNNVYQRSLAAGVPLEIDWHCFNDFYSWVIANLGPPPFPRARIVRKNQNKPFTRRNLEWNTHQAQGERYRTNTVIRFQGRSQCLKSWARELDLSFHTLYGRWSRGIQKPKELFSREKLIYG